MSNNQSNHKSLVVLLGFFALAASLYVVQKHALAGARAVNDDNTAQKGDPNMQETAVVGKKAPDFTLVDHKGKSHTLSDYRNKFVVLEWINYDCPFVVKHYKSKNMQKLQETYMKKNVVWLAIASSAEGKQGHFDSEEIDRRMKERNSKPTAYLIDEDGIVGRSYAAKTTPHMFVIDPQGTLRYDGAIDSIRSADMGDIPKATNYVSASLDALLAGKEIAGPTKTVPYGCSVKY